MADNSEEVIWSGSDMTYACLIDSKRTLAFKQAISETVKPGDIVIDVGSGTGILSFFAADAGAKKVYAVEVDPVLAAYLRKSVAANGLTDVINVVEGDAQDAELPSNADVVIAELIETGLIEEMQVKVVNTLRGRGIIGSSTKIIPQKYETFVQLAELDNTFYGHKITAPVHDWPNYSTGQENWEQLNAPGLTDPKQIGLFDFAAGMVEPEVTKSLEFDAANLAKVSAVKLMGKVYLTESVVLGATNSLNGDKYLTIDPLAPNSDGKFSVEISYKMGGGYPSFTLKSL